MGHNLILVSLSLVERNPLQAKNAKKKPHQAAVSFNTMTKDELTE
jgi:hypothetical protein